MRVIGLGTDIVEVKRIERFAQKPGALERIFTPQEIAYCRARKNTYQHLAVRFAAKEAVVKAFGTGMRGGTWQDIEIVVDEAGAPHVKLHGYFAYSATKRKIYNIFISLSHSKEYAIAQAILEG